LNDFDDDTVITLIKIIINDNIISLSS